MFFYRVFIPKGNCHHIYVYILLNNPKPSLSYLLKYVPFGSYRSNPIRNSNKKIITLVGSIDTFKSIEARYTNAEGKLNHGCKSFFFF